MASIDEGALRELLKGSSFVRELIVVDTTGSTNDDAMRRMDAGAPEGTVVIAASQTAGRGRLGRAWHSAPGDGLYLSVVLRPEGPIEQLTRYTIASALAACEASRASCGAPIVIEWPNDLMFEGRKVAGTLAELRSAGGVVTGLVLGTGFNVNQAPGDFPADLCERAVSLRTAGGGAAVLRERLAADYLTRLGSVTAALKREGWAAIARAWLALAPDAIGRRVEVAPERAKPALAGTTAGIDENGALLVTRPDGSVLHVRMSESVTAREGA